MAGPTPVSALIHAATMVTAGVYMIARVSFLYNHTPLAMDVVAVVGLFTAVFAATIGITQNDIKKVFAYSTVSQLGYMFLGVGCRRLFGRYLPPDDARLLQGAAVSGCGQRHSRTRRRTGSPPHGRPSQSHAHHLLHACCIASLAISGFPGFSGFFSKDAILAAAYEHAPWMFWVGAITAGMTAFYVFRAFFLAFFGTLSRPSSSARIASCHDRSADRSGGSFARRRIHQRSQMACSQPTRWPSTRIPRR